MHSNMPRGAIVAVVNLIDDVPTAVLLHWFSVGLVGFTPGVNEVDFGDYGTGRRGYLMENIRPLLKPVLCRGMQAMPFTVPADAEALVREQLKAVA